MSECEDKLAKIMESFRKVNASRNASYSGIIERSLSITGFKWKLLW